MKGGWVTISYIVVSTLLINGGVTVLTDVQTHSTQNYT